MALMDSLQGDDDTQLQLPAQAATSAASQLPTHAPDELQHTTSDLTALALDQLETAEEVAPAAPAAAAADSLTDPIFWIDLEMSGLDPMHHTILEVAVIASDGALEKLVDGPSLCIHHGDDVLEKMNDWSTNQHGSSGLTERCRTSSTSLADAEAALLTFVETHAGGRPAVLGGACVYKDLEFIARHMPTLRAKLSHRVVDVSTVRQLAWRWQPTAARHAPRGEGSSHRALDDIRYSIDELKYYRDTLFKPMEKRGRARQSGGTGHNNGPGRPRGRVR